MRHLVIVDGHHLLYRAYWAIPRTMCTSAGEQVNTSFGVASMLLQILKTEEPDDMVFCFDAGEETFRHQEYEEYKSGRAETPDDFYTQIPRALSLIDAFGIESVSGSNYEADDYAGSYARRAAERDERVTIVSGDRDLFQLVSQKIRIAVPHKGYQAAEYFGPREVQEKFGVTPAQIPFYKGLVGDPSDNLHGVKGIGPKAAVALLQQYGSIEGIYAHLPEVKLSWRKKLEEGKEQAIFCHRMAELVTDIPLPVPLDALALKEIPPEPVFQIFQELAFTLVTRRFQALLATAYGQAHFLQEAQAVDRGEPVAVEKIHQDSTAQLSLL